MAQLCLAFPTMAVLLSLLLTPACGLAQHGAAWCGGHATGGLGGCHGQRTLGSRRVQRRARGNTRVERQPTATDSRRRGRRHEDRTVRFRDALAAGREDLHARHWRQLDSVMRVLTAQPAARFVADIGLDRNVDNTAASVTMHVAVDGQDRFQTPRAPAGRQACRRSTCRSTARRALIWSSTTVVTGAGGTRRIGRMRA